MIFDLSALQSLARTNRVDGDGVVVQTSDNDKGNRQGDAGQEEEPSSVRAPCKVLRQVVGNGILNISALRDGVGIRKLVTRTSGAAGTVTLKSTSDSHKSQKGDDHCNNQKKGSEHDNATSDSGSKLINNFGTEGSIEDKEEVNGQDSRNQQCSQSKGLNKLDDAKHVGVAVVSSGSSGVDVARVDKGVLLLKIEGQNSVVQRNGGTRSNTNISRGRGLKVEGL